MPKSCCICCAHSSVPIRTTFNVLAVRLSMCLFINLKFLSSIQTCMFVFCPIFIYFFFIDFVFSLIKLLLMARVGNTIIFVLFFLLHFIYCPKLKEEKKSRNTTICCCCAVVLFSSLLLLLFIIFECGTLRVSE